MSPTVQKALGTLLDQAHRTVAEMIRERGGSASNVRESGHLAYRTLEETAAAAVKKDRLAAKALKLVKGAGRLGQKY